MLFPPGHEPSLARRRRVAAAVGLSLAVHLVALLVFLALGVAPPAPPGAGDPGEYVLVVGEGDWPPGDTGPWPGGAPSLPPPAPDRGVPAPVGTSPAARGSGTGSPGGGGGGTGRSERRRSGARRGQAAGPPTAAPIPDGRPLTPSAPPPAQAAPVDPAAEAARAAFRAELRRRLKESWRSYEVYQRVDPDNRLQGSLFTSVVELRLRGDGKIERSKLTGSSGVPALDQQALAAVGELKPLPPVPRHMLDAQGGLTVNCKFFLDVGMFLFAAKIRQAIEGVWRPSQAFAHAGEDSDRTTVLRLLLARDGKLLSTNVVSSAGIDFLDENPRKALTPGMSLPVPPPAFTRQPGPAQVFVAFVHKAGVVRVLKPREDIEEE